MFCLSEYKQIVGENGASGHVGHEVFLPFKPCPDKACAVACESYLSERRVVNSGVKHGSILLIYLHNYNGVCGKKQPLLENCLTPPAKLAIINSTDGVLSTFA